jgi:hypothetical protein
LGTGWQAGLRPPYGAYAALIAYILLRIAARLARRNDIPPIRFAELVAASLLLRKPIEHIDKPNPPRQQKPKANPNQMTLSLKQ